MNYINTVSSSQSLKLDLIKNHSIVIFSRSAVAAPHLSPLSLPLFSSEIQDLFSNNTLYCDDIEGTVPSLKQFASTVVSQSLLMSWTASMTLSPQSSKSKVPQVNSVIGPPRDSEKQGTCVKQSGDRVSRDQTRNKSPDISRVLTCDKSRDPICFRWARSPLIKKWQIVGMINNQRRHVTPVIG
jgi:hypothetical protein